MGSCDLCGGRFAVAHTVPEMMYGTREEFTYCECGTCGSLQLLDVPENLGLYYPDDYYSFGSKRPSLAKRLAKRARTEAAVHGMRRLSGLIAIGAGAPNWTTWLAEASLDRSATICDVGSGGGDLLHDMKDQGCRNLSGIDAFIPESTTVRGIDIQKATPGELDGKYDLIMLNHSFEHMPNPLETIKALASHLTARGSLMIRVPVAGSPIWDEYGTDWSSIDAPRHLYLPTHTGMRAVVERSGMRLASTLHETSVVQFWRSEQYRRGVPLRDPRAHEINPSASGLTTVQITGWKHKVEEMNRSGHSAAAAFFITHVTSTKASTVEESDRTAASRRRPRC